MARGSSQANPLSLPRIGEICSRPDVRVEDKRWTTQALGNSYKAKADSTSPSLHVPSNLETRASCPAKNPSRKESSPLCQLELPFLAASWETGQSEWEGGKVCSHWVRGMQYEVPLTLVPKGLLTAGVILAGVGASVSSVRAFDLAMTDKGQFLVQDCRWLERWRC